MTLQRQAKCPSNNVYSSLQDSVSLMPKINVNEQVRYIEEKILRDENDSEDEIAAAVLEFNQWKLDRVLMSFDELLEGTDKVWPFQKAVHKTADDEFVDLRIKSMDQKFLDVVKKLDFPPLEDDRVYMKMRLFTRKSAAVS